MKHYRIKIKGVVDLICMGPRTDEESPVGKTGKDRPDEWKTAIHYDAKTSCLCMPAVNIEKTMTSGAAGVKAGKHFLTKLFLSGVFVEPDLVPFVGIKAKLDDLPKNPQVYVRRDLVCIPPRIGKQVWKHRLAVKSGWQLKFDVTVHHDEISENALKTVLQNAGRFSGLGTWRPRHGRFDVVSVEEMQGRHHRRGEDWIGKD